MDNPVNNLWITLVFVDNSVDILWITLALVDNLWITGQEKPLFKSHIGRDRSVSRHLHF